MTTNITISILGTPQTFIIVTEHTFDKNCRWFVYTEANQGIIFNGTVYKDRFCVDYSSDRCRFIYEWLTKKVKTQLKKEKYRFVN